MVQKIVHMSSSHDCLDTRIFLKEARSLANAGYDVSYIAPAKEAVVLDGVKIIPIRGAGTRLERFTSTMFRMYRKGLILRADLYHIHDLDMIPAGFLLKLVHRKKVVYDAHEDAPLDIMSKDYIPHFLRTPVAWMVRGLEWLASRCFDRVVAATPSISKNFPVRKTVIVQNLPLKSEMAVDQGEKVPYLQRDPIIAYVGGVDPIRGVRQLVDAMALLDKSLKVTLVIAGQFSPPDLEDELAARPGWRNVRCLGWQSRSQVRELLAKARAGVVSFLPAPNHINAQPTKMFEYMSAGLPVIASHFPLWKEILDRNQCGLTVNPENPAEISAAIEWIITHPLESARMGEMGEHAVKGVLNWETESRKLLESYRAM